jgi:hypothetical protein
MQRKSALERNQDAAHALIAKPAEGWTGADTVAAYNLLKKFNRHEHPAAPFNLLEQAMGRAPVSNFAAALVKIRWFTEQPGGALDEYTERQEWEPAAYRTLRDFLSPKADFVAELGRTMGHVIRRIVAADRLQQTKKVNSLTDELYAVEALIEVSKPTTLAGIAGQLVLAIGHLELITNMNPKGGDAQAIREYALKTRGMLALATTALAEIAGVDLEADYRASYRTLCDLSPEPVKSWIPATDAPKGKTKSSSARTATKQEEMRHAA